MVSLGGANSISTKGEGPKDMDLQFFLERWRWMRDDVGPAF